MLPLGSVSDQSRSMTDERKTTKMSTPASLLTDAQPAAENISEKSHGGGPNTKAGKAASSQNAITHGLFAIRDFIRPDENEIYANFAQALHAELAPAGMLELNLADEIRRAMWRLRRCGQIEENFSGPVVNPNNEDPMQHEATAHLQQSVDRARSLSHRLLHRCTAELRKLQTERQYRNEYFDEGSNVSKLGLCDLRAVQKNIDSQHVREFHHLKREEEAAVDAMLAAPCAPLSRPTPEPPSSFCTGAPSSIPPQSQTPRNAPCPCGSGEKHKRCCGKNAPAVLHAA
jgi:hypothetical protein